MIVFNFNLSFYILPLFYQKCFQCKSLILSQMFLIPSSINLERVFRSTNFYVKFSTKESILMCLSIYFLNFTRNIFHVYLQCYLKIFIILPSINLELSLYLSFYLYNFHDNLYFYHVFLYISAILSEIVSM